MFQRVLYRIHQRLLDPTVFADYNCDNCQKFIKIELVSLVTNSSKWQICLYLECDIIIKDRSVMNLNAIFL